MWKTVPFLLISKGCFDPDKGETCGRALEKHGAPRNPNRSWALTTTGSCSILKAFWQLQGPLPNNPECPARGCSWMLPAPRAQDTHDCRKVCFLQAPVLNRMLRAHGDTSWESHFLCWVCSPGGPLLHHSSKQANNRKHFFKVINYLIVFLVAKS